jgi:hypothetical protein
MSRTAGSPLFAIGTNDPPAQACGAPSAVSSADAPVELATCEMTTRIAATMLQHRTDSKDLT